MSVMSSPFAISTPTTTVELAENRLGEMPFTITNMTDKPLRGRPMIVPLDSAPPEWFSLVSKPELDLAPRATVQVLVRVEPPLGAPAARQLFRVDVADSADPSAAPTVGPSCEVVVPPSTVRTNPWKTPRGYLATLLGSSIGGAVGELIIVFGFRAPRPKECTDLGCAFGEAIGQIIFLLIAILFGLILLWFGSVFGAWMGLRIKMYLGARLTALFLGILMVPWTIAMLWVLSKITDNLNLTVAVIVAPILLTAVPGVLARGAVLLIRTKHV
jgi:hypothetical protein